MHCLSLRQPYASLLLNGVKTLETRSGVQCAAALRSLAGQTLYIHIGMQPWPRDKGGENAWLEVAPPAARSEPAARHRMLKVPPALGDGRGCIAGIVTLGETQPIEEFARAEGWAAVEQRALVPQRMIASYATAITGARWLRKGLRRSCTGAGVYELAHEDARTLATY